MSLFDNLRPIGVIPVVTITDTAQALPLGEALMAGGLPCAEITLRTPQGLEAIRAMVHAYPTMWVGAGTVLNIAQAEAARQAGAQFLVSPGFVPALVEWAIAQQVPLLPGVMTASEIMQAVAWGVSHVKWFPAEESGGVRLLKALAAPFPTLKFIPTGGITAATLSAYLALPSVVACGGSWMVPSALLQAGRFNDIQTLVAAAVKGVQQSRTPVPLYE